MDSSENKQLHDLLFTVLAEYADTYSLVVSTNDFKNPFRENISKKIPALLQKCLNISEPYSIVGSYGKGRWTTVPWVAVFDTRITNSAQKGVYIVYLFNKDKKILYLALGMAATEAVKNEDDRQAFSVAGQSKNSAFDELHNRAVRIRKILNNTDFLSDDRIDSGSEIYDAGTVYYKKYELAVFPTADELIDDLHRMLDVYNDYYKWVQGVTANEPVWQANNNPADWWPTLSEYNPGITKERWVELFNTSGIIGPVWGGFLAAFYSEKDGASCKMIAEKYGRSPTSIVGNCAQFGKRIHSETNCPIGKRDNGQNRYWSIMFQGRNATEDEPGGFIWRLRPELYEALSEFDIMRFEWKREEEVSEVEPKEALAEIKNYIFASGFDYPDGLIENFYLSLKSKPFVILAGTSGTGKTKLVKLFAEAMGATFKLVSVRPDWSDGSDLFGHTDLNGKFIPGPVCSAFESAINEPQRPVFLCLDEMNLARVEYYLSDFLSVIESRKKENGHIVTEGIAQYENGIPDNLYIIGTVNMDETTFPFSKKVLDRANTIEFSYVDLMPKQREGEKTAPQKLPNSFLRTEYLVLATDCAMDKALVGKTCTELQALNQKLVKANAHVGYRVRDEIVFYLLNNEKAGDLLTYEQAMDNEIMQKILPRIQGSSAAVKALLIDMFKFCMGSSAGIDVDTGNVGEQMKIAAASAKYPESACKIGYMMARFEDDGFTSYWL